MIIKNGIIPMLGSHPLMNVAYERYGLLEVGDFYHPLDPYFPMIKIGSANKEDIPTTLYYSITGNYSEITDGIQASAIVIEPAVTWYNTYSGTTAQYIPLPALQNVVCAYNQASSFPDYYEDYEEHTATFIATASAKINWDWLKGNSSTNYGMPLMLGFVNHFNGPDHPPYLSGYISVAGR